MIGQLTLATTILTKLLFDLMIILQLLTHPGLGEKIHPIHRRFFAWETVGKSFARSHGSY